MGLMPLEMIGGSQGQERQESQEPVSSPAYRNHIPSWLWEEYQSVIKTRTIRNRKEEPRNKVVIMDPQQFGVTQIQYNVDGNTLFVLKNRQRITLLYGNIGSADSVVIINTEGALSINIFPSTNVTVSDGSTLIVGTRDNGYLLTFGNPEDIKKFLTKVGRNPEGGLDNTQAVPNEVVAGPSRPGAAAGATDAGDAADAMDAADAADAAVAAAIPQIEPSSSADESSGSGPYPSSGGTSTSTSFAISDGIVADLSPDVSSD